VRLVFSLLWSYLVRVRALQVATLITYLGDPTSPSGVFIHSLHYKFPILHLFFHFQLHQLSLCLRSCLSSIFNSVIIISLLPFYVLSYSTKHNHPYLILCFSFCLRFILYFLVLYNFLLLNLYFSLCYFKKNIFFLY